MWGESGHHHRTQRHCLCHLVAQGRYTIIWGGVCAECGPASGSKSNEVDSHARTHVVVLLLRWFTVVDGGFWVAWLTMVTGFALARWLVSPVLICLGALWTDEQTHYHERKAVVVLIIVVGRSDAFNSIDGNSDDV
jgi:hypothetical protein